MELWKLRGGDVLRREQQDLEAGGDEGALRDGGVRLTHGGIRRVARAPAWTFDVRWTWSGKTSRCCFGGYFAAVPRTGCLRYGRPGVSGAIDSPHFFARGLAVSV